LHYVFGLSVSIVKFCRLIRYKHKCEVASFNLGHRVFCWFTAACCCHCHQVLVPVSCDALMLPWRPLLQQYLSSVNVEFDPNCISISLSLVWHRTTDL